MSPSELIIDLLDDKAMGTGRHWVVQYVNKCYAKQLDVGNTLALIAHCTITKISFLSWKQKHQGKFTAIKKHN